MPFRSQSSASAVALIVASLLLGGCGLSRSTDAKPAASDDKVVGDAVTTTAANTDGTAAPSTTIGRAGSPTTTTTAVEGYANEVSRTDPSGFKLILSASAPLRYTKTSFPKFSLDIENVSTKVLHYDSNQLQFIGIRPADGRSGPSWDDSRCSKQGTSGFQGPPVTLEPGERVTLMVATYPGERTVPDRESCRVLTPGRYLVGGAVRWCPVVTDGLCDPAKVTTITSSALTITIQ